MKQNNTPPSNVIPIRRMDKFSVLTGKLHQDGSIEELFQVGNAYLKPGAKTFRMKFWMFPRESFFITREDDSDSLYTILSVEEYLAPNLEPKTVWRKVGMGVVVGNYIRLTFYILGEEFYLSLFPDAASAKEDAIAS